MRIVWLPRAAENLASIASYLEAEATRDVAQSVIGRIVKSATALLENPHLGHPSEAAEGIHEFHVPNSPIFSRTV
jgi:plasmid stabilization system protein ParE